MSNIIRTTILEYCISKRAILRRQMAVLRARIAMLDEMIEENSVPPIVPDGEEVEQLDYDTVMADLKKMRTPGSSVGAANIPSIEQAADVERGYQESLQESVVAGDPQNARLEKLSQGASLVSQVGRDYLDEPEEQDPVGAPPKQKASPLTDQDRQRVLTVIRRVGRFMWPNQIAAEMLRDGYDISPGWRVSVLMSSMVKAGMVVKVRFNNLPQFTCYGLAKWCLGGDGGLAKIDDPFLPIGRTFNDEQIEFISREDSNG